VGYIYKPLLAICPSLLHHNTPFSSVTKTSQARGRCPLLLLLLRKLALTATCPSKAALLSSPKHIPAQPMFLPASRPKAADWGFDGGGKNLKSKSVMASGSQKVPLPTFTCFLDLQFFSNPRPQLSMSCSSWSRKWHYGRYMVLPL
jgi:hypothetical protein